MLGLRVRVRGCGGVCAGVWVRVRVNPTWTIVAILPLIKAYHIQGRQLTHSRHDKELTENKNTERRLRPFGYDKP